MTGNQLLSAYNEIVINDLYPVLATSSAERLYYLNMAKRDIFRLLRYPAYRVLATITAGVQTYSLNTLPIPLYIVTNVNLDGSDLDRENWYQIAENITLVPAITASSVLKLTGYMRGLPIVADNNAITDIPEDLHMAIVYQAIYNSCGSQEDDNTQLLRLQTMVSRAMEKVIAIGNIQSRADFPFA
jgi:hypothetical protein